MSIKEREYNCFRQKAANKQCPIMHTDEHSRAFGLGLLNNHQFGHEHLNLVAPSDMGHLKVYYKQHLHIHSNSLGDSMFV